MHSGDGSFHGKASLLETDRPNFAAKVNANSRDTRRDTGCRPSRARVLLLDGRNGALLAVMDSMAITALRTAAGIAHSIVGGSAWGPTPRRAVQRAAWGVLNGEP